MRGSPSPMSPIGVWAYKHKTPPHTAVCGGVIIISAWEAQRPPRREVRFSCMRIPDSLLSEAVINCFIMDSKSLPDEAEAGAAEREGGAERPGACW